MKRSEALMPLSRDHHVALEVALRLRRADDDGAQDAVDHFLGFMEAGGEPHFAIEERELLPLAPAAMAERTRREHEELRAHARRLGERANLEEARAAGELLKAHVRFEERELFPALEAALSPAELEALGERVVDASR